METGRLGESCLRGERSPQRRPRRRAADRRPDLLGDRRVAGDRFVRANYGRSQPFSFYIRRDTLEGIHHIASAIVKS